MITEIPRLWPDQDSYRPLQVASVLAKYLTERGFLTHAEVIEYLRRVAPYFVAKGSGGLPSVDERIRRLLYTLTPRDRTVVYDRKEQQWRFRRESDGELDTRLVG